MVSIICAKVYLPHCPQGICLYPPNVLFVKGETHANRVKSGWDARGGLSRPCQRLIIERHSLKGTPLVTWQCLDNGRQWACLRNRLPWHGGMHQGLVANIGGIGCGHHRFCATMYSLFSFSNGGERHSEPPTTPQPSTLASTPSVFDCYFISNFEQRTHCLLC